MSDPLAAFRDEHTIITETFVPVSTKIYTNDNGLEGMIFAVALAVLVLLILAVGWHVAELRKRIRAIGVAAVREALE